MHVHGGCITGADVAAWPYSVGILCKFAAFFGSLHWPMDNVDMGILVVPIWRFLSFSSNGLVMDCSVKRSLGRMCELMVPFIFPLFLCQRELKLDMVVNSSVVWFGLWPSFLVVWVGSCHVELRHLGWNQCSHGLTPRPLESCHHQCLKAVCGVLGYPKGSAAELLDGTLKLRCCTTIFTVRFHPWSLPGVGIGDSARKVVTPGYSSDVRSSTVKRVRLTRKTRPGALFSHVSDPGHPTPRRWKRLPEGVGGEVGVPRNLFPRLGVG